MRQFYTSILVRREILSADFQTYPYETAWASEAIFFIRVERVVGAGAQLSAKVQISPDGINWVDEGSRFEPICSQGLYFVKVVHFGGWLRLDCVIDSQDKTQAPPSFELSVSLVLKE